MSEVDGSGNPFSAAMQQALAHVDAVREALVAMEPAVAIIGVPGRTEWEERTGIPLDERESTLAWIGHRALHDQVSGGGVFRVAGDHITLYGRS